VIHILRTILVVYQKMKNNNYTEKDLYGPIKIYFENVFSKDFDLKIKVFETHRVIQSNILDLFPTLNDVNAIYNYKPDLIFIIENSSQIGIIEVKDDPLKIIDVYQAKRYSEIIKSDFSFLISPFDFIKEDQGIIKNNENENITNYYIQDTEDNILIKKINIGIASFDAAKVKIDDIRFYSPLKFK
jgi:hypothetical protein